MFRLWKIFRVAGIPPPIWVAPNAFKIFEFYKMVDGSNLNEGHAILDIGCGKGGQILVLARRCDRAIGIDVSSSQIATARRFLSHSRLKKRVQFFCARLEEARFPAGSFDRIYSFSVFEHIANLDEVLAEAVKLLKPGGELHISVDSLATIKDADTIAFHRERNAVERYFEREELARYLETAGLKVIDIFPILTSEYARDEFEKRILYGTRYGPLKRMYLYQRLKREERNSNGSEGIMLVARARKPDASGPLGQVT